MQLSFQLAAELLPGQIGERGDIERDQCVVHHRVDPAPPPFGFVHHRGDIAGCGDIRMNRHGLSAGRGRGPYHLVCLLGAGVVVDDHAKPALREDKCGCRTDSAAGSGDQRDTTHQGCLPLRTRCRARCHARRRNHIDRNTRGQVVNDSARLAPTIRFRFTRAGG